MKISSGGGDSMSSTSVSVSILSSLIGAVSENSGSRFIYLFVRGEIILLYGDLFSLFDLSVEFTI